MISRTLISHLKQWFVYIYLILLAGCSATSTSAPHSGEQAQVSKNAPTGLVLEAKQGQVLSLISLTPRTGENARSVRKSYLETAFALGRRHGLKPLGALPVAEVAVGSFSPKAVSFYSWPSAEAEALFEREPDWPAIKATRPEGWDELRIHDVILERDLTIRFAPGKTYTMATAWINPDRPDDYDGYLAAVEPTLHAVGGRFVFQMREPAFSSLATQRGAPGRITFVEWDSPEGLADFQQSAGFRSHVRYLQSGTTAFELIFLGQPAG